MPHAIGLHREKTQTAPAAQTASASAQPNVLASARDTVLMTPKMWIMALLTGIGAGLTSGLLMRLLRLVQHASFAYTSGDFLAGVRHTSAAHRALVLTLGGIFAGVSLYLLRRFTRGPVPEVTGAIWQKQGRFPAAPALVKSLISIVIVGMGAAIGREAALKDVAAAVAGKLSDWTDLTAAQRHLLVACGAGAGMAAAYNVPLGGALFAVEVLLGTMSLTNVLAAVITSFAAVSISWLLLPNVPTFNVAPLSLSPSLLLWALITGPVLGAASAAYVRSIGWAESGKPRAIMVLVAPILVFLGLGLVAIRFPEILGNGKNVVQEAFSSQLGTGLLCWLLILRPLATAMCLKSGAPGGLFTPTMTFGALLGGLLGQGWSRLAPTTTAAGPHHDSYAIVGAGAMLASASQGPLSSIVFMLELTNHTDALIVPLLIAVAGATLTARKLEVHSIYSIRG